MVLFAPASEVTPAAMVTVVVSVAVRPRLSVTVRVYTVVTVGEAVGWATVASSSPVVGLQLYVYGVSPPVAEPSRATEPPADIVRPGPASTAKGSVTLPGTADMPLQQPKGRPEAASINPVTTKEPTRTRRIIIT